jgi:hypothetical protein
MVLLFALLGGFFGSIGPAATAAEPPLPLSLDLREIDPAPLLLPERDPLWRVCWLVEPAEEETSSAPSVFRWPEFAITITGERLQAENSEKYEPYYTGRLELGSAQLQKMEWEPKFFPAVSRFVFGIPTGLVEALTYWVVPDRVVANNKLVFDQVASEEDFATILGRSLLMAELKFYGSIPKSYLWKFGAQMGTEDLDKRRLNRYQVRAFFGGTKNAYRERFRIPGLDLDTVLSTFSTGDWMDFFIVPAVVSIYAAQFGIDRKIRISDNVRLDLQIEKATRFHKVFTSDHGGRLASASLNLFKLPVSLIVSFKAEGGGVGLEFIGIGTDINTALTALYNYEAPRDLGRPDLLDR